MAADLEHAVVCRRSDWGCYVGRYSVGAGLGWSRFREQTAFWPKLQIEAGLLNHISVELVAGTINVQQLYHSLNAAPTIIVGAGLRYYPFELYRGLVLNVTLVDHLYRQDLSNQRYTAQAAALSTLGWRWRPRDYAGSFVLGAGVQKELSGGTRIQPAFETEIAFDFNSDSLFF